MKDGFPNCALESDPVGGWFLIIAGTICLPIPFAVIALMLGHMVGETCAVVLWLAMCLGYPIWAYWLATKPFDED